MEYSGVRVCSVFPNRGTYSQQVRHKPRNPFPSSSASFRMRRISRHVSIAASVFKLHKLTSPRILLCTFETELSVISIITAIFAHVVALALAAATERSVWRVKTSQVPVLLPPPPLPFHQRDSHVPTGSGIVPTPERQDCSAFFATSHS